MRSFTLSPILLPLVLCAALPASAQDLFVTSRFGDEVLRFDPSGAFVEVFARRGLDNPVGLTFGPNGDLFVAAAVENRVLRFDGASGEGRGIFVELSNNCAVRQIQFGPDGNLYVACGGSNRIRRYDGQTGAPLGLFATHPSLNAPTSFTFGPDGDLYAVSVLGNRIVRFDGDTGAFLEVFSQSLHLSGPHDLVFGPDGRLWVSNAFSTRIVRLDPEDGSLFDTFVVDPALANPLGMTFTADGSLLVANQGADNVLRYDALNGTSLGELVPSGAGGLSGPLFLAQAPATGVGLPRCLSPSPGVAGEPNLFVAEGFEPGARGVLFLGTQLGSDGSPECPLAGLSLSAPRRIALASADEGGRLFAHVQPPAVLAGVTLFLQALDLRACRAGDVTSFQLQ